MGTPKVDVFVVGAGTAGAAAARACALQGLSVRCVDRAPLREAGAHWLNGVPEWAFSQAGLVPPTEPERVHEGGRFHLIAGWGPDRTVVDARGLLEVDMRLLVQRLQAEARAAGAQLQGSVQVTGVEIDTGAARVQTSDGPFSATVVVDAAGLRSPLRARTVPASELCVAAQQVREVVDVDRAQAWCRAQGVEPGDTLCFTGIAGGFSIVNVRVSVSPEPRVSLLTGSIPAGGQPSGVALLEAFVREQPWVGKQRSGGSRAIPLAPAPPVLVEGPVVRVGDAAGQVFASHGSGVAAGLLAAWQLGEVLGAGGTPWDWNVAWQRTWGADLVAANHFARFSRDLDLSTLRRLSGSGLMTPRLARQALLQRPSRLELGDLPRLIVGAFRARTIVRRIAPVASTLLKLERHQRAYPSQPAHLGPWIARRDALLDLG